ncbi:helix-turn-helix domain-containing protein [Streptomyces aquilus]|uniref:TetR/AcrR family transcriptional regulator n=1 Tax=Streptomyces aquilus TaxID=2548456 RepID=UPI0026D2EA08
MRTFTPLRAKVAQEGPTRNNIAEVALRLFVEHGYDEVGMRDVAEEADVAVTTVFAHFASKEALVFDQDEHHEERLVDAVANRSSDQSLLNALRAEVLNAARWFSTPKSIAFWTLVESSAALRGYASHMQARHEQALVSAIASDPRHPRPPPPAVRSPASPWTPTPWPGTPRTRWPQWRKSSTSSSPPSRPQRTDSQRSR